ncbi:hypothetical protein [Endozoicomonas lisbonensis]|uniref:Uncharacterized protein n=1 Tax=Endozoicomonas lisbonensis TaxID=3120522 RepID=A0ABV2SP95_9GAMM
MTAPKLKDLTTTKYVDDRVAEVIESAATRKELRETEERLQAQVDVHTDEFEHIETALVQITSDLNDTLGKAVNEQEKPRKQTLRERFARITGLSPGACRRSKQGH